MSKESLFEQLKLYSFKTITISLKAAVSWQKRTLSGGSQNLIPITNLPFMIRLLQLFNLVNVGPMTMFLDMIEFAS